MTDRSERVRAIREFILSNVADHPGDIARLTTERFHISRATAANHIGALVREGFLNASGNTKARSYQLRVLASMDVVLVITPGLEEDVVWRNEIAHLLADVPENALQICQYGFGEMLNNVVSHAEAPSVHIWLKKTATNISLVVEDDGIGIFKKIQNTFGYNDPRHALLELSKGKLTSDPERHTGEGIFFTSRMFDEFSILSGNLFFHRKNEADGWLIEAEDRDDSPGTYIVMNIHPQAKRTMREIFDRFATGEDMDFSRTHVPLNLARYEREQLLSRSQARRALARFERFAEVLLDFQNVEQIGQAFADEIFRVFHREHPEIRITRVNASLDVERMIKRVTPKDATA